VSAGIALAGAAVAVATVRKTIHADVVPEAVGA
jgi:hypothetical protein